MKASKVIEAIFELEDSDNTSASAIADNIGGSVVDVITICDQLKNDGLIEEVVGGYGLTDAGMDRLEVLTA